MCYLSDAQAAESHRRQEGVCALVGHRKWSVVYISQSQHQSIVEQEEANIRHLLKAPNHTKKRKKEVCSKYKTTVLHLECFKVLKYKTEHKFYLFCLVLKGQ